MLMLALSASVLSLGVAVPGAAGGRRIGWWWDAPESAQDPAVDALLAWCQKHKSIASSILMRCAVPNSKQGRQKHPDELFLNFFCPKSESSETTQVRPDNKGRGGGRRAAAFVRPSDPGAAGAR
eukprot:SAG31_NODE_8781_length_1388_cov_1.579519_1_plen_124_part_00